MNRNEYNQYPLAHFRKRTKSPSAIIIHYISAINTHPLDPFNPKNSIAILKKLKLSYHYIIDREGEVTQLVKEGDQAFHAGKGQLFGQHHPNNFTIGISLIATDKSGFSYKQMKELVILTRKIRLQYHIPLNRIVGHEHISWNRKNPKKDPGKKFDWMYYLDKSRVIE